MRFWNWRVMAKDPWRLALGGLRILAGRIFCGVPINNTLSPQSIYETSWFWKRRVMAKDPWRLALGGLRILARRIFCGVPCCFGGSVLRKWRIGATPTLRIHIIRLKTAKWGWLGPSKMAATPLLCLRAFDHFTPARPGRERLLVSDLHVRTDRACESF